MVSNLFFTETTKLLFVDEMTFKSEVFMAFTAENRENLPKKNAFDIRVCRDDTTSREIRSDRI